MGYPDGLLSGCLFGWLAGCHLGVVASPSLGQIMHMTPRIFSENIEKRGPVFEPVFRPRFLIPRKEKVLKKRPYSGLEYWTAFRRFFVFFSAFSFRAYVLFGRVSSGLRRTIQCSGSVGILLGLFRSHCCNYYFSGLVCDGNASRGQGNRTANASKNQSAIRSSKRALVALPGFGR